MGFFDSYTPEAQGNWVSADEKEALIDSSTSFSIVGVSFQAGDKYGDRYVLDIALDGEERKIGFGAGTVDSRDRMLVAMTEYLATPGATPPEVRLESAGKAVLIVPA